jgi:large subunit ribosomal protein L4
MEAKVYNRDGKEVSKVSLPEKIFGLKWNADLVHQVVTAMQGNARGPVAHTKDRSAVRGGGKKPWKQKGTGRARHGSRRSPIWVGGGITHGPDKERDYTRKINKKMKTAALFTVLSRKYRDGELIFLDDLSFSKPKTKDASDMLAKIGKAVGHNQVAYKTGKRVLLSTPAIEVNTDRSFRNLKSVLVKPAIEINPVDAMSYRFLVIVDPEKSLATLVGKSVKSKK